MIKAYIPNNFLPERKYVINILFHEFLGLEYNIESNPSIKNYQIKLENCNEIIIEDHFFSRFEKDLNYLDPKNIPYNVKFAKNDFLVENDIPAIFGKINPIKIMKYKSRRTIICSIDIFASSFFMLTRWEEYTNKIRDQHGRFPVSQSLAFKHGFLNRPLVNEYVEFLWNMLLSLNCEQTRKVRHFQLLPTHDVDWLLYWYNSLQSFRIIWKDIFGKFDIKTARNHIKNYYRTKNGYVNDPYDTYNWLMNLSEANNIKSRFYFMAAGKSKKDNRYDISGEKSQKILNNILSRQHILGIHTSYSSYNNARQVEIEKKLLESVINFPVIEGRQHYLRFEVPYIWRLCEYSNIQFDSSLGFPEKEGFRCGTGDTFTVFDFLESKTLKVSETPLIFMDGQFAPVNQNISSDQSTKILTELIKISKKYKSALTILFHNSIFVQYNELNFINLYQHIFRTAYEN